MHSSSRTEFCCDNLNNSWDLHQKRCIRQYGRFQHAKAYQFLACRQLLMNCDICSEMFTQQIQRSLSSSVQLLYMRLPFSKQTVLLLQSKNVICHMVWYMCIVLYWQPSSDKQKYICNMWVHWESWSRLMCAMQARRGQKVNQRRNCGNDQEHSQTMNMSYCH